MINLLAKKIFQPLRFKQLRYVVTSALIVSISVLLAACDNTVSHTPVTLDTNAYYAIYQKGPSEKWRTIYYNNSRYRLKTTTFTVEDQLTPYTMVFVCPSDRGDKPHEITVIHATASELDLIDYKCRVAEDDLIKKPLYGKVKGVAIANPDNPAGEMAHVALSVDVAANVHEAYAEIVRSGLRDVVAYKGKQIENRIASPEKFYIERGVALPLTTDPQEEEVDLSKSKLGSFLGDFNVESPVTVDISGVASDESLQAAVGFLSEKKTYLKLQESSAKSFSFLEVPLTVADSEDNLLDSHFYPGEGHELTVSVFDNEGYEIKKLTDIFTLTENKNLTIHVPDGVNSSVSIGRNNVDQFQQITLDWQAYQSANLTAGLYHWILTGIAAKPKDGELPDVEVDRVKWNIYVTPSWLKQNSSASSYSLKLPVSYDVRVVDPNAQQDDKDALVYVWRYEWAFNASSDVDWELSAYAVDDNARSNDVLDYIVNRNFIKSFQFTQANIRGSTVVQ